MNTIKLASMPTEAPPTEAPPTALSPLVGYVELTATLGISRRAAERMVAAGTLPSPDVRIGRLVRWKPSTIQAWINAGGVR
jgi:excisionase family DNA binding protein